MALNLCRIFFTTASHFLTKRCKVLRILRNIYSKMLDVIDSCVSPILLFGNVSSNFDGNAKCLDVSVAFLFSIWVSFHLTFTDHITEGKLGGQF